LGPVQAGTNSVVSPSAPPAAGGRRRRTGARGEDLGGRPEGVAALAVEQQHVAGVAGGEVDVVEHHRHPGAAGGQLRSGRAPDLVVQVEVGEGFVEQIQRGCCTSSAAMARRWRSPPERVGTWRSAKPARPICASAAIAMASSSGPSQSQRPR
jgi:hypothetical protein